MCKGLLALIALTCSACGSAESQPTANFAGDSSNGGSPFTPGCSLSIKGTFQNISDGLVLTVSDRNGACGATLSCGFSGYVFSTGVANEYIFIAAISEGDTAGSCGWPAQSTNSNGKSGPYYIGNLGLYTGQWLGTVKPSQPNQWSKL